MKLPREGNPYFLGVLFAVTIAFGWLLTPLFGAVFWAAAFAVVFVPVERRLVARFGGNETMAAAVTLMLCVVLVIVPTLLVITALVSEGASLVQLLSAEGSGIDVARLFETFKSALPAVLQEQINRIAPDNLAGMRQRVTDMAVSLSQLVATKAFSIGQDTVQFLISLTVMVYLLFFLLRDGDHLIARFERVVPLNREHSSRLLATYATIVRATIRGNLVVAVVQGVAGGAIFWLLDIERALLWGAVMAFLSILPAIGSALVWAPTGLYLLATGSMLQGAVLLAFGAGVISMADNVLRPILVGKDTRIPDYLVLIATIGGLALFGLNGAVIGPLIAGLFIAAWSIYAEDD